MPSRAGLRAALAPALLACLVAASDAAAFEIAGASLEVDLTTPDRASAVLVLALPEGLERLELTWLELGGSSLEGIDARLLGPSGASSTALTPVTTARGGPRPAFDLDIPLRTMRDDTLRLSYRATVSPEGPVTVPIPAPSALLAARAALLVEVRIPADRSLASAFPAGLREAARDSTSAVYRAELPVVPAMLRFRLVPADRWWSGPLLVDLAVAAILLTLLAFGWRRFARIR